VASTPEALAALISSDLPLADPATYSSPASAANIVAVDVVGRTLLTTVTAGVLGESSREFKTAERGERRREGSLLSPETEAFKVQHRSASEAPLASVKSI